MHYLYPLLLAILLPTLATAAPVDISRTELQARMAQATEQLILDVRTPEEFANGHIAGAINVPHDQILTRLPELAAWRTRDIVLYCRSGRRAELAATLLEAQGYTRLHHLDGDMQGWEAAGLPQAR